jgi:TP901 family phage tail tape measure protein
VAQSKYQQALLRSSAAQARYEELQASGTATTRQLASAQASMIAAQDRVALSNERVSKSQMLGARSADRAKSAWAAIPGPVKMAAAAVAAVGVGSLVAASKFQTATMRIHTQADATVAQTNAIRKGILGMAASVGTMPNTLADAAYHIASVGQKSLTTAQQLAVLRTAAEGAKLGNADLTDVTNALDAAIVANMKGVQNYSQVMGVMNATVGAGDMTMQDFADAFGPLGSTFKGFGVSIQQAGAALAVFGDNNIRGALAGSQLRQTITSLAVPLKAGQDQLKQWGINSGNLSAQLHHGGLTEALDVLAQKFRENGITASEMGPKLAEMFGKRGPQQGLSTLINELDRYHNKLGIVTDAGQSFSSKWAAYTHTLGFAWDRIKAGADAAAIAIGNKLLPMATKAVGWFGTTGINDIEKFWHAFSSNSLVRGGFSALESAVGHIASALGSAAHAVQPFASALLQIGGGAVLLAFRGVAAAVDGIAHALSAVAGFLAQHRTLVTAAAAAYTATLIPAVLQTIRVFTAAMGIVAGRTMFANLASGIGNVKTALVEAEGAGAKFSAGLGALGLNPVTAALAAVAAGAVYLTSVLRHQNQVAFQAGTQAAQAYVKSLNDMHTSSVTTAADTEQIAARFRQVATTQSTFSSKTLGQLAALGAARAQSAHVTRVEQYNEAQLARQYGLTAGQIQRLAGRIGGLNGSWQQVGARAAAALGPTAQLTSDTKTLKTAAQGSANAVNALADAFARIAGDAISADDAMTTLHDDARQLRKAIDASNGSFTMTSSVGSAARHMLNQLAAGALDAATRFSKMKGGTDRARASLQFAIGVIQATGGNSQVAQKRVDELRAALQQVGTQHPHPTVNVQTSQAQAALHNLLGTLQGIASHVWTATVTTIHNLITHSSSTGTGPGHARGGPITGQIVGPAYRDVRQHPDADLAW